MGRNLPLAASRISGNRIYATGKAANFDLFNEFHLCHPYAVSELTSRLSIIRIKIENRVRAGVQKACSVLLVGMVLGHRFCDGKYTHPSDISETDSFEVLRTVTVHRTI